MINLINSVVKIKDGQPIPSAHAKLLVQTYRDEEGHGDKKTRAVWFSVPDLAKILELATSTLNGRTCNGTRIYFAKYPDNDVVIKPPSLEYLRRETLVFVPTYDEIVDGVTKRRDIFNVLDPIGPLDDPQGFNHGELCPPNTGCP